MLGGRKAGARLRWRCVPPALAAVLVLAFVPLTARADECPPGDVCLSAAALRQCDADQMALPEVRLQLRVAEQRLAVAAGDALALSRALEAQSVLVVELRRAVASARPWLPGWAWVGIGAVLGVVGSVVLALAL